MNQPVRIESFATKPRDKIPWALDAREVVNRLKTDAQTGLSPQEAQERLQQDGLNVLKQEKKATRLQKFLAQIKSPVVIILLVATIISALLGEWVDATAIMAIVILNAVIGYLQEAKAEAAIEALKHLTAPKTRVCRDGKVIEITATKICRGDILVFEAGDYVPADARIILANQLSADEAILTGESLPVKKVIEQIGEDAILAERVNMLFGSTAIATGSGRAVVTATGMETELGKIARMLQASAPVETPLQIRLAQVSKKLLIFCAVVVGTVGLLGLYHGESWLDVLMTAISLSVAAIPEGLPAVVTLALALAIGRMAKRNAIVRHLPAVETLGSVDVICTDKTGTLTTGKMRVREVVLPGKMFAAEDVGLDQNKDFQRLVEASVLCSNASLNGDVATGDPTEVALLYLAKDRQMDPARIHALYSRLMEWSFDSLRKRMSVAVKEGEKVLIHVKGAPEMLLPLCDLTENERAFLAQSMDNLSSQGRRLLAVATKEVESAFFQAGCVREASSVENNLGFLGVVSIADPPRPETLPAIRDCKDAGIQVVMITGDHPATARAIALELGILVPGKFDGVISGPELDRMSIEELEKRVEQTAVYARVSPEHKLNIVRAWKNRGKMVAMTGDGVNDAPALKESSIGVAMGKGGTEVARQSSAIILTDDHFATIVSAVEEGRAIYGNIRRTIQYLLSGNLAEILIMLGAAVAGWPTPLAPIHLLWINLVTDGFPSLALAAEPVPPGILRSSRKPSPSAFFDQSFYRELSFVGIVTAILALIVYGYSLHTEDEITARTHLFSILVFAELFRSVACRSETKTFFQMGIRSNLYLLVAVAIPVIFQIVLHHHSIFQNIFKVKSLGWTECVVTTGLTLIPVTLIEMRKWLKQKRKLIT